MRTLLYGAAIAVLASATLAGSQAQAQPYPLRTRVYAVPPGVDRDEAQDYNYDQLLRRQSIQRESLAYRQKSERRIVDPDEIDELDD